MSSAAKKNTPDLENKKPISKSCLLEKLDIHVNKLIEEVERKTSDFQKSFQSLSDRIKCYRLRDPCQSMQEYFCIIQKLNENFDDLENKSSDFVENICHLRVKSLLIDGLKDSPEEDDKRESSVVDNLRFNFNSSNPHFNLSRNNLSAISCIEDSDETWDNEMIEIYNNEKISQERDSGKGQDQNQAEATDKRNNLKSKDPSTVNQTLHSRKVKKGHFDWDTSFSPKQNKVASSAVKNIQCDWKMISNSFDSESSSSSDKIIELPECLSTENHRPAMKIKNFKNKNSDAASASTSNVNLSKINTNMHEENGKRQKITKKKEEEVDRELPEINSSSPLENLIMKPLDMCESNRKIFRFNCSSAFKDIVSE